MSDERTGFGTDLARMQRLCHRSSPGSPEWDAAAEAISALFGRLRAPRRERSRPKTTAKVRP